MVYRGIRLFADSAPATPATTHDGRGQGWRLARVKPDYTMGHVSARYVRRTQ